MTKNNLAAEVIDEKYQSAYMYTAAVIALKEWICMPLPYIFSLMTPNAISIVTTAIIATL